MKMTIRALRVNQGMTQKELASDVGVSASTLANWERGKTFPDVDQINKLLELFHVRYDDIIFLNPSTV